MKAKTKKRLLIIGSLLAIGGIVGGFVLNRAKKKEAESIDPVSNEPLKTSGETSVTSTSGDSVSSGGGSKIENKTGLNYPITKRGIKLFQKYSREIKKHKTNIGNLISVDGVFGNNSREAWNLYAKSYIIRLGLNSTQWNTIGFKK